MCAHYGDNKGVAPDTCLINPRLLLDGGSDVPQQCIDNGDYTPNTEHLFDEERDADKLRELAMDVLQHGDPLEYMVKVINTMHVGDQQAARLLILSMLVQNVYNAKGFHPGLHGPSGKGKTDLCKAVKHIAPRECVVETSLSGKALFYAGLKQGVVVFCDDLDLTDELRSTLKRATTNFTEPTRHTTVIQGKGKTLTIPPRVTWWLTSVDADSDEQVLNREIPIDIDDTPETDELVYRHQCDMARTGRPAYPETNEVRVCRCILKILKDALYTVVVPYADRIVWENKNNRRNLDVFLDLVKSIALLYRYQRNTTMNLDGTTTIQSTVADYEKARQVYGFVGETQATKLTEAEKRVVRFLGCRAREDQDRYGHAFFEEIQEYLGVSKGRCYTILHGRDGKGGLLAKIPGLYHQKMTETEYKTTITGEDAYEHMEKTGSRSRAKNLYTLDTKRYNPFADFSNITYLGEEGT